MSILIKGMEMPKNCKECPFSDHEAWCLIPGDWKERYYCPDDEVSDNCPLVEVYPLQGQLIDSDKLFQMMENTGWHNNADRDGVAEELLLNTPTVIEAENDIEHSD